MQSAEIPQEFQDTPVVSVGAGLSLCSLAALRPGDRARVQLVQPCSRELRLRLLAMGLVAGQVIEVLQLAPLGDPMTVQVLGSELALRLSEASQILVAPLGA